MAQVHSDEEGVAVGHERVGHLPRTKQWKTIVASMYAPPDVAVEPNTGSERAGEVAALTLRNVRKQLAKLEQDPSLRTAFTFLVCFAQAGNAHDPPNAMAWMGAYMGPSPSPLDIARAVTVWLQRSGGQPEYQQLLGQACSTAIVEWLASKRTGQARLLDTLQDPHEYWRAAGTGSGFCELSRRFFAQLTQRYLNYFLEREASAAAPSIAERQALQDRLEAHVQHVSLHAFEIAKITQSFAAGWFNNHAVERQPTEADVAGFLRHAIGKMRDELLREDGPS